MAEAGIGDPRLYDGSRGTAGTILNELGVDMPTMMEIQRHTQDEPDAPLRQGPLAPLEGRRAPHGRCLSCPPRNLPLSPQLDPELRRETAARPAPRPPS